MEPIKHCWSVKVHPGYECTARANSSFLMLWWRVQSEGLGPLQRSLAKIVPKSLCGAHWCFWGAVGPPWHVSDAPLAARWQQGRVEKEKHSRKPDSSLKTQPKPYPSISLSLAWGALSQEPVDFGHRPWPRGCSGFRKGHRAACAWEKGWAGAAEFDALQDFPMDLLPGRWFEMCLRLPSSSSGLVLLLMEENEQRRLRKA